MEIISGQDAYEIYASELFRLTGINPDGWEQLTWQDQEQWEAVAYEQCLKDREEVCYA